MVKKYDYRIVGRTHLAPLEQGVRQLQRDGWELVYPDPDGSMTLEEALDACAPPELGGPVTGTLLSVSMRKEIRLEVIK